MAEFPQAPLELSSRIPTATTPRLTWHLATNQLNLFYLLANGLITGPRGFGRKYYDDPLAVTPGWIPLFGDVIPTRAFEQALSEGTHLRRVVAALDLSMLTGPVCAVDQRGQMRELHFPDELNGEEQVLFVPAPLPASWIGAILFASKEDRAATLDEAANYANVPLGSYKQQINKPKLFSGRTLTTWPVGADALPPRDTPSHTVSALGAAMALAFALGNRGDAMVSAERLLFDPFDAAPDTLADPLLGALHQWARLSPAGDTGEVQTRLLLETLQAIVEERTNADAAHEGEARKADSWQAVLDLLESPKPWLTEDKWQDALNRIAGDLRGILGLGDNTVSELLQRHPRPFSRGLILFFLRQRCDTFLDFQEPLLTEMDLLVAMMLFAARSGWMGVPTELREHAGLAEAVQHRMAALAHQDTQTGLDLGPVPKRIESLRGLFTPPQSDWNKRQRDAALKLARSMRWEAILQTRISLGKGDYRLQITGNGVQLLLDGDVKGVLTEVDQRGLLDQLAQATIPPRLDKEIRALLKV